MDTRCEGCLDLHEHGAEEEDFAHTGDGAVVLCGELVAEVGVGGGDGTDGTDGTDGDGFGFGFHENGTNGIPQARETDWTDGGFGW